MNLRITKNMTSVSEKAYFRSQDFSAISRIHHFLVPFASGYGTGLRPVMRDFRSDFRA